MFNWFKETFNYIISSPSFLIKSTYNYIYDTKKYNEIKTEETDSWKDYFYWKFNRNNYIAELEKIIYYETTIKENIPIINVQNNNVVFTQILYEIKNDIYEDLKLKKKELEGFSCRFFKERKANLILEYHEKILSYEFTLQHLGDVVQQHLQRKDLREKQLREILEIKILRTEKSSAEEREKYLQAQQELQNQNNDLKKVNESLIKDYDEKNKQNLRLAYAVEH